MTMTALLAQCKGVRYKSGRPGVQFSLTLEFSGSSHTSNLKIGYQVATLPGSGIIGSVLSMLWLGEIESLICNFYLNVAARSLVWADPSQRDTSILLGHKATSKQNKTKQNIVLDAQT